MSMLEPEAVRRRLVLVEDDRHSIDALRTAFADLGCECEVALDLSTAMTILGERRMDVAVVNAKATDMKEEQLIDELKDASPGIRIVIYNGTKSKARQRRLRRQGADSYLSTASDMAAVARSVERVLGVQP